MILRNLSVNVGNCSDRVPSQNSKAIVMSYQHGGIYELYELMNYVCRVRVWNRGVISFFFFTLFT